MESFGYSSRDKEKLAILIGLIGVMIFFIGTFLPFATFSDWNYYYRSHSIYDIVILPFMEVEHGGPGICFFFPLLLAFYVLPINCLYRFAKKQKPVKSAIGVLVGIILFFTFISLIDSHTYASTGFYLMTAGAIMMIAGTVMMPKPFKQKQSYYKYSPPPPPPPVNRDDSRKLRLASCPNCGQSKKDNDVCFYCGQRY